MDGEEPSISAPASSVSGALRLSLTSATVEKSTAELESPHPDIADPVVGTVGRRRVAGPSSPGRSTEGEGEVTVRGRKKRKKTTQHGPEQVPGV